MEDLHVPSKTEQGNNGKKLEIWQFFFPLKPYFMPFLVEID